jgi:hypothetical protein
LVKAGDQIGVDQPLVNLDNPEWRRLSQLAALPTNTTPVRNTKLGGSERQLLNTRIGRAQARVKVLEDLVSRGAVSPGKC